MLVRRTLTAITLLLLLAVLGAVPGTVGRPGNALADTDFEMAVDYPSVVVEPGKTVSLNLRLMNRSKTSRQVNLTVAKVPDGWESVLKDRGYIIRSMYVGPEENKIITFEAVPADTVKPGDYPFQVRADTQDGTSQTLTVNVGVAEKVISGTKVTSQYPVLRGPSGSKFEFKVDLSNGTGEDQSYNLAATGPQGWEIAFQPAYESKQISSIRMKAGETGGLNIQVTPPKQEAAGEYPIELQISAGSERISGSLKVVLTGTYEMIVGTSSERLNMEATAGEESSISVLVSNIGSAPLQGVSFSSTKPSAWNVTFDPKTVDVAPGTTKEVNVFVRPDDKAIAGDYLITLNASTPQASERADIRVTVQTPTVWGWVGMGIVIMVMGGLYGVFKTFSRR